MENIDEVIADARAEEEANKAALKDFRETLRDKLKDTFTVEAVEIQKVTIDLEEYVQLRLLAENLNKLTCIIEDSLELNYNSTKLRLKDDQSITTLYKLLYPVSYNTIYDTLLKSKEEKQIEGE